MNYGSRTEPDFYPGFNLISLIDRWGGFNVEVLYMGYFGSVASQQCFEDLDMKKFHEEFPKRFGDRILGHHYKRTASDEAWMEDHTYVLEKEIIVFKEKDEVSVLFCDEACALVKEILDFTGSLKKEEEHKAFINLIIMQPHGLDNRKIDFEKPKLDLSKTYNEDFAAFNEKIMKILKEENKSGLHLLYGKPGTGKSTYLKYICGQVKKKIIFLPGQMAQNLDNIAMTRYLMNNANCILVIEDAEELIVSRDQQRNSNLAMILNITDGILGESLGIQIIATFNTDVQNIDPALRRKGRLKSAYEFKPLPPQKATVLLKEQQIDLCAEKEMTLAEIYNVTEEEQFKGRDRKAVGFR